MVQTVTIDPATENQASILKEVFSLTTVLKKASTPRLRISS